jgi:hypothetical protein
MDPQASKAARILGLLGDAKRLAREYRALTGKPLGITGEVAEFEAARLLPVRLMPPRQSGFDAFERVNGQIRKLQIKGRCLQSDSKKRQRLGRIDVKKDWDGVLLVLLDASYEATEILEADRGPILAELSKPGSKARTERGALGVSAFRRIARRRWPKSSAQIGRKQRRPRKFGSLSRDSAG